jgi:hypothetical protein
MDNMGGNGGVPNSAGELPKAPDFTVPQAEAENFDNFLNSREDLKPNMEGLPTPEVSEEMAEIEVESMPDVAEGAAAPVAEPEPEAPKEEGETPALTHLKEIKVPRDAESLPKEYVDAIAKIIESDKRNPGRLVEDLDKARWDMMSKAFGRNKGDGLSGGGAING